MRRGRRSIRGLFEGSWIDWWRELRVCCYVAAMWKRLVLVGLEGLLERK